MNITDDPIEILHNRVTLQLKMSIFFRVMATAHHLLRRKMTDPETRNHGSLPLISAPLKDKTQKKKAGEIQHLTKLPSIYIPSVPVSRSPNLKIQLTDFIGNRPDSYKGETIHDSDLKVNIIARDKAIQLLQQYNEIVGGNENLAVKNLPPIKVSIRPSGADLGFKKDKMSKKIPVFTEGISSISKRQEPSFTVPKENVIRANLPRNVVVAQKKNKFTFGVKNNKKHRKDDKGELPQFKQMKKLGLDSMPSVDMGRYLNKSQMMQESVNLRSGIKGAYFKSPRKGDDKIEEENQTNGQRGYESDRTRVLSKKTYPQSTSRSESKLSVVSVGDSLGPSYFSNRRNQKGEFSLFDARMHNEAHRMRYQPRDPSIYGVCSLAPIHVGGPLQRVGTLDPILQGPQKSNKSLKGPKKKSQKGKRKDAYSDIGPWQSDVIIPTEFQKENGELLPVANEVLEDTDYSETMSYQRELLFRKNMTSPTGSESTMTTHTHIANPPPSYVSSNDDDYSRQFDNPRAMLQIQEEQSNLTLENVEAHNRDMEINSIATSNSIMRRRKDGRRSRVKPEPKIVNLEIEGEKSGRTSVIEDGLFLTIPSVSVDLEKRPPHTVKAEVDRNINDSRATCYSTRSDNDNPKLAVKNIRFHNDHIQIPDTNVVTPEINVTSDNSDTEIILKANNDDSKENLARVDTEEEFKKFTMSNKTMQFISPLQVIDNAKRH